MGITAGGNYGKGYGNGYGNGDDVTYAYSRIDDKQSQTTITSGKTTALLGTQVYGNKVKIDTHDLTIRSLQETSTYKSKQQNLSGQVTVGYTETAVGLFKSGEVEYTVAPGDNVGTGIGLPWVSGALGLGIGNTSATGGKDGFRIPILGMLSGDHTEAYYRDRESIEFLYSKGNNWNKVNKIINNQEEKWGQVGPKTKTFQFENKKIIGEKK